MTLMAVATFVKGGTQNTFQEQVQYQQMEFYGLPDYSTWIQKSSCFALLLNISTTGSTYICLSLSWGPPPTEFNSTKSRTFKMKRNIYFLHYKMLQSSYDVHVHVKPEFLSPFHIQLCRISNMLCLLSASKMYYFLRWGVEGKQINRAGQAKLRSQKNATFSATSWSPMKQDFKLSLDSLINKYPGAFCVWW